MIKDADGKVCGAKTAYMATLAVVLFKMATSGIIYGGIVFGVADFSGMSLILGATAATYYGRSHTKANV